MTSFHANYVVDGQHFNLCTRVAIIATLQLMSCDVVISDRHVMRRNIDVVERRTHKMSVWHSEFCYFELRSGVQVWSSLTSLLPETLSGREAPYEFFYKDKPLF